MNHLPPQPTAPQAVTVDRSTELLAVLADRVRIMVSQRVGYAESMIAVGEICLKLRDTLPRTVYGERVRQIVNLKTARKAIDRYLASLPVVNVRATSQKPEQNPPTRGLVSLSVRDGDQKPEHNPQTRYPSGTEIGTQGTACHTIGSAQDVLDLLGDTAVPSDHARDGVDLGDEGDVDWEEELDGDDEGTEFEISNFKGESEESPLRLDPHTDSAPPPAGPGEERKAKPVAVGPQMTLASLYEQARSVGSEFIRAIESTWVDEKTKSRLVVEVGQLVRAALASTGGV